MKIARSIAAPLTVSTRIPQGNPPVGADQLLFIDGGPASTPGKSLPIIPYKVTIVAGQANALSFVPHLHFQKTTGMVDISNTGVERIVTDPDLPGFQMKIPAGAQIIGWDGQPNTQISVRRVPIDRIPVVTLCSPTIRSYRQGSVLEASVGAMARRLRGKRGVVYLR
jgi:hypothetical protein